MILMASFNNVRFISLQYFSFLRRPFSSRHSRHHHLHILPVRLHSHLPGLLRNLHFRSRRSLHHTRHLGNLLFHHHGLRHSLLGLHRVHLRSLHHGLRHSLLGLHR